MKRQLLTVFILSILFLTCRGKNASDPNLLFGKANQAYAAEKYTDAISMYEELIKSGFIAKEVYFNLGNSYFKEKNISKAVLNYERARVLDPGDEDVNFNLRLAYNNTVDKIEPVPMLFYQRWWESFLKIFSPGTWNIIAILSVWLTLFMAIAYLFAKTPNARRNTFLITFSLLFITSAFYFIGYSSEKATYGNKEAIVITSSSYIRSSPDEKSTKLFMLHEGTKVSIVDEQDDWKRIKIANGNVGWVQGSSLEKI